MIDIPKVSIIVPVYNSESYLDDCMRSILNQSLREIEIIIVNDGSTDNSLNLLDQYVQKDNRIKIINQRNMGAGIARNAGIEQAQGEYIGFVDADDWIDHNYYESLYIDAKKNQADITRTLQMRYYPDKVVELPNNGTIRKRFQNNELLNKNDHAFGALTALYKRDMLIKNNIYFDVMRSSHDKIFTVKTMFFANKIAPVVGTYYHHRDNVPGQLISFNVSRLKNASHADRQLVNFANNVKYDDIDEYVGLFKKLLNEANVYCRRAISDKDIPMSEIRKYFSGMVYIYKHCKHKDKLYKIFDTQLILSLKKRSFNQYYAFCEGRENMNIPIVLSSDNRGAGLLAVTILSILETATVSIYDFYILVSSDFSLKNKLRIMKIIKRYGFNVTFVNMKNRFEKAPIRISHIAIPTYYRLLITKLLPPEVEKCFYLDIDIIIKNDLNVLFNTDIDDFYVAGVISLGYLKKPNYNEFLGIPDVNCYINAGMLLMNLKLLRRDNIINRFLSLLEKDYPSMDQDIINVACYGRIKLLPLKYNAFTFWVFDSVKKLSLAWTENEVLEARSDPVIIHYANKIKPWDDKTMVWAEEWWNYCSKTKFFKQFNNAYLKRNQTMEKMTFRSFFGKLRRKIIRLLLGRELFQHLTNLNQLYDNVANLKDTLNVNMEMISQKLSNIEKETIKLADESTRVIRDTITPVNESVQVIKDTIKPVSESVKLIRDTIKPVSESVKAIKDTIKPIRESVQTTIKQTNDKLLNALIRTTPKATLTTVVISLVEHCNLNCKGCDHCAPLADKIFLDVAEFEKDIRRLAELSKEETVGTIKLMGGEPLLHPDIHKFTKIARKFLPESRIEITTNGLLLSKQRDAFWINCRENNIVIVATKYPIDIDWDGICDKAKSEDVLFEFYGTSGTVLKTSRFNPFDISGTQDTAINFMQCFHANNCRELYHGRLYTCTIIPHAKHFNKAFNQKLNECEADSIDIYNAKNMEEILEYLARPIPFCRYCDVSARTFGNPWQQSNREIGEWVVKE